MNNFPCMAHGCNHQKIIKYKYFIKKTIVQGEQFLEHQYTPRSENWVGIWKKGNLS